PRVGADGGEGGAVGREGDGGDGANVPGQLGDRTDHRHLLQGGRADGGGVRPRDAGRGLAAAAAFDLRETLLHGDGRARDADADQQLEEDRPPADAAAALDGARTYGGLALLLTLGIGLLGKDDQLLAGLLLVVAQDARQLDR